MWIDLRSAYYLIGICVAIFLYILRLEHRLTKIETKIDAFTTKTK
jgi:hypothetical protein